MRTTVVLGGHVYVVAGALTGISDVGPDADGFQVTLKDPRPKFFRSTRLANINEAPEAAEEIALAVGRCCEEGGYDAIVPSRDNV